MQTTTPVARRALLKGAALAALFAGAAPALLPRAAGAEPAIAAKPLFWTDGPLHSMFAVGHHDETRFLAAARTAADEFLCDHTEDTHFADWGNEKDVLAEWSEADVFHQHRRWVVQERDRNTGEPRIVRVLRPGTDGYPVDDGDAAYDSENASLVKCAPSDDGAFAVTFIRSGLEA